MYKIDDMVGGKPKCTQITACQNT